MKTNGYSFAVEKNVKMPKPYASRQRKPKRAHYPFPEMKRGDSFAVPLSMETRVRALAFMQPRGKFATRKMGDVVRCWRVA